MAFFSSKTNERQQPAVRQRGWRRFFQLLARDGWNWYFAGGLAALSALPFLIGMIVSVEENALLPMLLTSPLGGLLTAPQLVGLADTLLRSLRDEESAWWATYRRSWKRNVRASLLPGAVFGLLFGIQLFTLCHVVTAEPDLAVGAWVMLSVLLITPVVAELLVLQAAVELPFQSLLRSAVILCFRKPARTLGALLIQLAYWGALVWLYPRSLVAFGLLHFWFPTAISTLLIYPPLEEAFDLENRIRELKEK